MKAVKQLQQASVVRPSESTCRSNVVMVPKPTASTDIRQISKADYLTGQQNKSELYRLCLDFCELNSILEFDLNTQFTTIDSFLYTLKNKVVCSLDISSSFFIISIEETDKFKTAFWINEFAFEFNSCVMGLKSSPHHLNKFLEKAFSPQAYLNSLSQLSPEERNLVPPSFQDFVKNYFDDYFIFADNYEILHIC